MSDPEKQVRVALVSLKEGGNNVFFREQTGIPVRGP